MILDCKIKVLDKKWKVLYNILEKPFPQRPLCYNINYNRGGNISEQIYKNGKKRRCN